MENMKIIELVEKELRNWEWLSDHTSRIEHLDAYSAFLRLATETKDQTANFTDLDKLDEEASRTFSEIFEKPDYIYSTSAKGRFVRSIQDKLVAVECLIAFASGIDHVTEGRINALLFKKGFRKEYLSESVKLTELLDELKGKSKELSSKSEQLLADLAEELRASQQAVIELTSECSALRIESEKQKRAVLDIEEIKNNLGGALKLELEAKVSNATKVYNDSVKSLQDQLDAEKVASKQRFDSFVDAYRNQMRLKAPVQYWIENVKHHKDLAFKFGLSSVLLSILIFLPIGFVAWEILAGEQIIWGKVGVVAFTTSLAIWLIRVLVRMYLSHNHMQMNSQERVVMTKAYLALISEGGASSDEERNLILQAIFRPVSTGIITDDASPHNIIELINKSRK